MSKIEEKLVNEIRVRAIEGKSKYGTTMERNDLSLHEWLQHLKEELMDAAIYVTKLQEEVRDENEERDLRNYDEDAIEDRMKHIGQNGNTGEHYETITHTMYPGDIKVTYEEIIK